ncbi:hypothetical protein [Methanolobus psychrotolerans]|uniref:hypothetical protein n=1 Tax=Methanolobus psychrotolerans TaxID=1874706 RepID=UPI00101AD4B3|nr:hypothetical protein [Methanolobus psychrotolerans]
MKVASLFMTMLIVSMFVVAPATACAPAAPQDPISASEEKEVIDGVSKEIKMPDEYTIARNVDTDGFLFIYQESAEVFKIIDISKNYKVKEIWEVTSSAIVGGYQVSLVSDKGNEVSVTVNGDMSSNTGEMTIYNSSTGEVTTKSLTCYGLCMSTCGGLGGTGCGSACPYLCGVLIETGIGYIACVGVCLAACFIDITYGCDKVCDAIC